MVRILNNDNKTYIIGFALNNKAVTKRNKITT